jgi:hypothetical protein
LLAGVVLVHRGEHVAGPQQRLTEIIQNLLVEAVDAHAVRPDFPPDELACYYINTFAAAGNLWSKSAVKRLVALVLAGLRAGE